MSTMVQLILFQSFEFLSDHKFDETLLPTSSPSRFETSRIYLFHRNIASKYDKLHLPIPQRFLNEPFLTKLIYQRYEQLTSVARKQTRVSRLSIKTPIIRTGDKPIDAQSEFHSFAIFLLETETAIELTNSKEERQRERKPIMNRTLSVT